MADKYWAAVYDVVLSGLKDAQVLELPPKSEAELGHIAETVTDHVVVAVTLSRQQREEAWARRRQRIRKSLGI